MYTTLISASDLAAHLGHPGWVVIDSRHELTTPTHGRDAHARSRIPGARFVDLDTQLAGRHTGQNGRHPLPDPAVFRQIVSQLGIGADTQVVVHDDHTGQSAGRFWWMLRWLGHEGVAVLDGGFKGWEASGFPIDSDPISASPPVAIVPAAPLPEVATGASGPLAPTVTTPDMLVNLRSHAATVVDARAGARYRGETEPLDPVAGHIPGALNRPFQENLLPDGRFKSAADLKNEFAALLGDAAPQDVIHQCGSGVSACHNLLAMAHAGLPGSRLYPGSWSEWCADPGRPVAIGATP
jgi:thiosulfate/3-mercaptopyruvate sulfurtransferase